MREQCGGEKEASPEGGETDNLEIICGTGRGRKITLSGQENRRHTERREDIKTQKGGQRKGVKINTNKREGKSWQPKTERST